MKVSSMIQHLPLGGILFVSQNQFVSPPFLQENVLISMEMMSNFFFFLNVYIRVMLTGTLRTIINKLY